MSPSSFPGIARTLYVRPRLRLADTPRPEKTDWALIKGAIDGALDELSTAVKTRRSNITARSGAQSGGAVRLFVFRTFRSEDRPGADAIVAGVTFLDEGGSIKGRADVCRETSGVLISEVEHEVNDPSEMEDVAASLAAHLARLADEVIDAVDAAPAEPA